MPSSTTSVIPFGFDLVCELHDARDAVAILHRQRQPAEPAILVGTRPDRRVAIPDAAHDVLLVKRRDALLAPCWTRLSGRLQLKSVVGMMCSGAGLNGLTLPSRSLERERQAVTEEKRHEPA